MNSFWKWAVALALPIALAGAPLAAQPSDKGPVTNLPLPRFVSLKANEGNARRGPDTSHRVDWVFTRRDQPLRVTAEFEHWRRVEDADGQGGWMHYALLSGVRSALVQGDMVPVHSRPEGGGTVAALLERGVIVQLRECQRDWCLLQVAEASGWAEKRHLWGVAEDEVF